ADRDELHDHGRGRRPVVDRARAAAVGRAAGPVSRQRLRHPGPSRGDLHAPVAHTGRCDALIERRRLRSMPDVDDPAPGPEPGGRADPDSRARTHLANERTFIAWFRTGVAMIALGIAAAQFLSHDAFGGVPVVRVLATLLVVGGTVLVCVGAVRYTTGRVRIDAAAFRPAHWSIVVTTVAAVVTGLIAIVFVWVLQPK